MLSLRNRNKSFIIGGDSPCLNLYIERCYSQSSINRWPVLEQLIFSAKERWRESTSNKFKTSQFIHSLPTFQDGGAPPVEGSIVAKRFFMQTGSEGCLLLHTNRPDVEKIHQIYLGRKSVRISMPMFRTRSSTINFHKTNENPNISFEEVKRQSNCFSRRHVVMGTSREELIWAQQTIFLMENLGFVINQKKSQLEPVQKIEFLGLIIDSVSLTLALPTEKI